MPHSKTPGGQQASDKFLKHEAQKHGETDPSKITPGDAPVASDSGSTNVGVRSDSTNVPGEKGISGVKVDSEPTQQGQAQSK